MMVEPVMVVYCRGVVVFSGWNYDVWEYDYSYIMGMATLRSMGIAIREI